jgi:hypothetical protein
MQVDPVVEAISALAGRISNLEVDRPSNVTLVHGHAGASSGGFLPYFATPTYIVYIDGGTIKARNTTTGVIDFSGADAATVIQAAIDACTGGQGILLAAGDYYIATTLDITGTVDPRYGSAHPYIPPRLAGESKHSTRLIYDGADPIIKAVGTSGYRVWGLTLSEIGLDGLGNATTAAYLEYVNNAYLADITAYNFGNRGLSLKSSINVVAAACNFPHCGGLAATGAAIYSEAGTTLQLIGVGVRGGTPWDGNAAHIQHGIVINGTNNCRLRGVIVEEQGNSGLYAYGSILGLVVDECYFEANGERAIYVSGANGVVLRDNFLFKDQQYAGGSYEVRLVGVVGGLLEGNYITPDGTTQHIYIHTDCYDIALQNNVKAGATAFVSDNGVRTTYQANVGYVTANRGAATLLSGTTSLAVSHGLSVTPTIVNITFAEQGTADYGRWWISAVGATQFTLNVSTDPGASNLDFWWEALKL